MTLADRIDQLVDRLTRRTRCRGDDVRVVYSPLRVCPLGAHIDHQEGLVTGMALDRSVLVGFVPRSDGRVIVESLNYQGLVDFDLACIPRAKGGHWGDYARGAALALQRYRATIGIDALVEGNTPVGGLSSSAAIGVALLLALEAANDLELSIEQNILLDRFIENNYLGLQNGILDQSIILRAQPDRLLCLDCQSGETLWIATAAPRASYDILVVYSGLAKSLVHTDYNQRVAECRQAAAAMLAAAQLPVAVEPRLRSIPEEGFDTLASRLDPPLDRRARHFVTEMGRVREGVAAWEAGDLSRLGALITASGESSISNYEAGCPHLVSLFQVLCGCPGVYGARFAGGGFRGCCVGVSDPAYRGQIEATVRAHYAAAHPEVGAACRVYFAHSGGPARILHGQAGHALL